MAAFRSGFPYSVLSPIAAPVFGGSEVENQRANLIGPAYSPARWRRPVAETC